MVEKTVEMTFPQLLQAHNAEKMRIEALNGRLADLQKMLSETLAAETSVMEIEKAKEGGKILVSLGAGTFADAELAGKGKFLVSLPGNVLKYISVAETKKLLSERREQISKESGRVNEEIQKGMDNFNNLSKVIDTVVRAGKPK